MAVLRSAYKPDRGVQREHETEAVRAVRRAVPGYNFISWRDVNSGRWSIAIKFDDGYYLDVLRCGNGERPFLTRGMIESVKSMLYAAKRGKGPLAEYEADAKEWEDAFMREQQEFQEAALDRRKWMRRRLSRHSQMLADLPFFRSVVGR